VCSSDLIDFGVDADSVLAGLDYLNLVKEESDKRRDSRRRESAPVAPRTELEKTIVAVWQEAIGVDTVGINDDFFDLGGSPVLMEKIHSRLEKILNRNISMMHMFKYMTVSSLAKHLSSDQNAGAPLQEMRGRAETRRALMRRKPQPKSRHTS